MEKKTFFFLIATPKFNLFASHDKGQVAFTWLNEQAPFDGVEVKIQF